MQKQSLLRSRKNQRIGGWGEGRGAEMGHIIIHLSTTIVRVLRVGRVPGTMTGVGEMVTNTSSPDSSHHGAHDPSVEKETTQAHTPTSVGGDKIFLTHLRFLAGDPQINLQRQTKQRNKQKLNNTCIPHAHGNFQREYHRGVVRTQAYRAC